MMINEHKTSRAWLKFEHFFRTTWKIEVRVKIVIKISVQQRWKANKHTEKNTLSYGECAVNEFE